MHVIVCKREIVNTRLDYNISYRSQLDEARRCKAIAEVSLQLVFKLTYTR
jgi:hypothetical protein